MSTSGGLNFGLGWRRRAPMILQTQAAECGLACMAMIAAYHGAHHSMSDLRRRFGMSLRGATLQDLVRVAEQLSLASRPLRLELDELPLLKTPCVLHWDLNHFVVLAGVRGARVTVHDPSVGIRVLTLDEISPHFTGVALELTPLSCFTPVRSAPRIRITELVGQIVGLRSSLGQVLALALAMEALAVLSPLFLQWVVDHALLSADRNLLLTLVIGFGLLSLLGIALSTMRRWVLMVIGATLKVDGRTNLFTHLVSLPAPYFESRHLGDVVSRFGSQQSILRTLTTDAVEVILDGLLGVFTLAVMFFLSPFLTVLVVAGAASYAALRLSSYGALRQISMEALAWGARADSHFFETLRGIKAIKLHNGQPGRRCHWMGLLVETVNRQLSAQKLRLVYRTADSLIDSALAIVVVWKGAEQVLGHVLTVGMLLAFIAYKDQFLDRVGSLTNKALELRMLRIHAERLADIALTAPESPPTLARISRTWEKPPPISMQKVCFRYSENDAWVLKDVSFELGAGESVAIVGSSGCGKTTLLKLLAALIHPAQGEIRIDGQPLARLDIDAYRSNIGVVMQDDQLFAGSLGDNISFFAEEPDVQRVESCAKLAAIHEDILAMPMGYSTLVGDMGAILSGGQKQRVLIARALYRNPKILLLDEATSHLDIDRESEVNAAVRQLPLTRIIVAHRPETIHSADRVLELVDGCVVREGAPRSPLATVGR